MMWNRQISFRAVAVVLAAVLMVGIGCEREEFEPEARSATDGASSAERPATDGASSGGEEASHYSVRVPESRLETGRSEAVSLQVEPDSEMRINLDFPWRLEVEETDGVEIGTSTLKSDEMELTEEVATIPVELRAVEAGEHRVEARGDFSVCNDEICHVLRDQQVDFVVDAR